ncbi:hypothetical protein B9W64_27100 [Streptomyces sp. CS159]|nr:hypothetical protein B9W64_27100 [Streptomyces sp. CS159]
MPLGRPATRTPRSAATRRRRSAGRPRTSERPWARAPTACRCRGPPPSIPHRRRPPAPGTAAAPAPRPA